MAFYNEGLQGEGYNRWEQTKCVHRIPYGDTVHFHVKSCPGPVKAFELPWILPPIP